jgi:hypothetical protein
MLGCASKLMTPSTGKHEDLNMYWNAFVNFCRWPEPKKHARLEAYDTNLKLGGYDLRRPVIFYEASRSKLGIWTKVTVKKPEELSRESHCRS